MKILIIGHGGHGKDTVASIIKEKVGLTFSSSSIKACEIFIFDALKNKYNYQTIEECFNDRHNHRKEWYDLICEYNKEDRSKLAFKILETEDMYVGMRDDEEFQACKEKKLFNWVIGVYDPSKPEEKESFNIDFWNVCDFIIPNNSVNTDLKTLEKKVTKILGVLC